MKRPLATVGALLLASTLLAPSTASARPPDPGAAPAGSGTPAAGSAPSHRRPAAHPDRVRDPDARLGSGWRRSADRAVTTSSDATGLHVLVADESQAYAWRTAATLAEPGFDTDQWIGQACVTGSGRRAVVVYAPRTFTNKDVLMQRGGFAAVVDLKTGAVTKLPERVSLAYHNPGCGAGEDVVLSRLEQPSRPGEDARTWLGRVDTRRPAAAIRVVRATGQVSSALPVGKRLIGAKGLSLVQVGAKGAVKSLSSTDATPFRLLADGPDGVAFQVVRNGRTEFKRFSAGRVTAHGSAPVGEVKLRAGAGGRVFAVGGRAEERMAKGLPGTWRAVDGLPDSDISTTGALAVLRATTGREAAGRLEARPGDGQAERVEILARRTANDNRLDFSVDPQVTGVGRVSSPSLAGASGGSAGARAGGSTGARTAASTGDPDVTDDPDRSCAVSRNDPKIQVYQPTVAQMEWAADLAVRNMLTFQRPANWNNNGMAAYSPQEMFPSLALAGGGNVPAQVFLGILAQESNLWQASYHAVDASVGNPLTSVGYYGLDLGSPKYELIDWAKTDCGYGAGQVTSGMKRTDKDQWIAGVQWTETKQKAVALDYATNVAAGLRILQDKWNQTRNAGLIANNGDPKYIENWWFAIWAYNTGFYPQDPQNPSAPWGVGWANNPANTDYPADRKRFLTAPLDVPNADPPIDDEVGYDNAKHPNHWSYPERVTGFAYTSLIRYNYKTKGWTPTYATAQARQPDVAQAARYTFCEPDINDCDETLPPKIPGDFPKTAAGACQRDDLRCWWHGPVTWTDCAVNCGLENRRYTAVEPRPYAQPGDNVHPTPVTSDGACKVEGLPSTGVKIIDDIDTTVPLGAEGCRPDYTKGGRFSMNFATYTQYGGNVVTPGKVDLHQIGAGFGGHFWFSHTYHKDQQPTYRITGTWTINPTNAWTRVWAHLPDHGAHTRQADYIIRRPNGAVEHRIIPTQWESNRWVNLGVFDFTGSGTPKVELSNFTRDGAGVQDVAWDAIAVQPLASKPRHFVVALGDSYSSGEGTGDYTRVSDQYGDDDLTRNSCRRSANAWSQKAVIPGAPGNIGSLAAANNPLIDAQFVACSGARTHNMLSPDLVSTADKKWYGNDVEGKYGEISQLDQGSLNANTTAVMFSIGGNDARFTDVAMACARQTDCSASDYVMDGDPKPLRQMQSELVQGEVKESVREVVRQIRLRAPNARIFVMGYPHLFEPNCEFGLVLPGITIGFSWDETIFLNQMADMLTNQALPSDAANKVHGMDARGTFAGHTVCGGDYYINGPVAGDVLRDDDGDPKQLVSMESFHPNKAGGLAYASVLNDYMATYNYRW
ncbi:SGNH/GDSL hydrolase family protein [Micromonospora sp. NPDC005686]|uniref:SGNH/GDSL hydrolase family protein n=1 Tax=unclassified Micromonospora TaxID=2617518 RepID=UPI0033BA9877